MYITFSALKNPLNFSHDFFLYYAINVSWEIYQKTVFMALNQNLILELNMGHLYLNKMNTEISFLTLFQWGRNKMV